MLNYLVDNWYMCSVIFASASSLFLFCSIILSMKIAGEDESLWSLIEEFPFIAVIMSIIMPIINVIFSFLLIIFGLSLLIPEIKNKKNEKKEIFNEMNQFYKTNCCNVLVRLHHVYKHNHSLEKKHIKKCVACKKDIVFNDLSLYKDEAILDKYESKIPYQTKLTKKEFRNIKDTIYYEKSKSLFDEEEAKYIQLTINNLENKDKEK